MKLKYYLRGLGIGIVVTALLMGVAMKDSGAMTDEEVKARAAELGMVEQRTLADIRDNMNAATPTEVTQSQESVGTEIPAETQEPVGTEISTESQEPVGTQVPAETQEPVTTETPGTESTEDPLSTEAPKAGDKVTIEIENGDSSEAVSRKLADAGLIESISEFNRYLVENKLTKVIDIGTYEIEVGITIEEIAEIITN